jgi:hypothetical protein
MRYFAARYPGSTDLKQRTVAATARISANNRKEAANTRGADGYQSFGTGWSCLQLVYSQRKKVHWLSPLWDAEAAMNQPLRRAAQGCCWVFERIAAMKSETPAHRYRREAAECELNAEKATNTADRLAWQRLAEDWTRLARGSDVNHRLSTLEGI